MLDAQIAPSPFPTYEAPTSTLQLGPTAFPEGTGPVVIGETPLPPTLGEYKLLERVARGGMGGVYLGEHQRTGARVALKVLDSRWWSHQDIVDRLLGEHIVSARTTHQGLVRTLEAAVTEDGVPYLAMELIDGESLATLIERGSIELGAVAAIGAQIADACAALHEAGVVHCDLKPENVMVLYHEGLAGWPRIKVLDFGVARFGELAENVEIAGTPCYMSPEQWRGHAEPRSDVYGLGCLLYELLTGQVPFEGSLSHMMYEHCNTLPLPPSRLHTVPAALDRLVMRMLSKDPAMRPRMSDVARTLTDLAYALPPGARLAMARAVNQ
jgi:eukaryotic-like serine/threonine-protein kinase